MLLSFNLILLVSALYMQGAKGQQSAVSTHIFRILNATDIISSEAPVSAMIAFDNYACMSMCTQNSNCVLVVFKFANNNCNLYNLSALTRAVTSTDSIVYQKPNNG
jgi:hypothetical protein